MRLPPLTGCVVLVPVKAFGEAKARLAPTLDAKLPEAKRKELARSYANRAMDYLRRAVTLGYHDAAHTRQDTDLDVLRDRDDFKKILGEI